MTSSCYNEDSDGGDISLSLPLSRSSPQLSSLGQRGFNFTPSETTNQSNQAGPSRYRQIPSPTPNRLLGKQLWPRPETKVEQEEECVFGSGEEIGSRIMTRRASSQETITLNRSRSINIRLNKEKDSLVSKSDSLEPGIRKTPSMRVGWKRIPGENRPPPMVGSDTSLKMSRWIKEIVVCNFDLERGPVVERRILGRRWGPGEKENVAFSSFPDTSLFAEGDIQFSFKIRHIPPDLSIPEPPSPMPNKTFSTEQALLDDSTRDRHPGQSGLGNGLLGKESKAEEYRQWDERGREWLYGYVWFEQRRDGGIARGYMQKSLVILSHLPFPALFAKVLDTIAPVFFQHGYSALEAACHAIASWPDPTHDTVLELPLLSNILTVKLPDFSDTPQLAILNPAKPSIPRPILASLPPSSPLRTFASVLPSLWSIWECLILAEPVLVIAPDPKTCSEMVWWLRDLLRPIPPAGDFRPYLHIHDHDFSLLVNSNKPRPGLVVGVTNPFFRNAASHWPNVISIPSDKPNRAPNAQKVEQPHGFISRRHRSVQKDRPLLKRLETLVAEGRFDDVEGNEDLRTHFQQLTEKMMVPLNRYFQTLIPTLSPNPSTTSIQSLSTFPSMNGTFSNGTLGSMKAFSLPSFLSHLKTRGPNPLSFKSRGLISKARIESDFYTSFCMSPTFAGWLSSNVSSLDSAVTMRNNRRGSEEVLSNEFGIKLGFGITPLEGMTDGTRSPTQWSSGVSESATEFRGSSDGSSVGQWDEPIRRR